MLSLLSVVICGVALGGGPAMPIPVEAGAYQPVFLTDEEVTEVRERATTTDYGKAIRKMLIAQADSVLSTTPEIPHAGGQWSHYYTCPEDGGRLKASSPTLHVCSVCKKEYSGWPYDEVYVTYRHNEYLRSLETLGWAYVLDPKGAYAERVRAILLEYTEFYESLPLHNNKNKESNSAARLYAQTLDESVSLCQLLVGYDRVYRDPCFSEADHQKIETHLLRPMVETIQRNDMGFSNWQTWHNAGVCCVGLLLRDRDLVDWAINGKSGFLFQMEKSVMNSGMWYEESPSYHWYALQALVYMMEGAERAGLDLYSLRKVKLLFDAPVRQLFPDNTFPALHDSNRGGLQNSRRFYEIAWKRFKDPRYLPLLAPRNVDWSLMWGADAPENFQAPPTPQSTNSQSEGLAILRDAENKTALFLDYGPGLSGHVQPAKLGIILYAHGEERFVDPGRLPYGNPMHKGWYKQTVAHNTVVVNLDSQIRSPGALLAYESTPAWDLVRAEALRAYKGVRLDRCLIRRENCIVDIYQCWAGKNVLFDLPLHMRGALAAIEGAEPCAPLGKTNGYDYLQDTMRLPEGLESLSLDCGDGRRIHVEFLRSSMMHLAKGFGKNPQEILPVVIQRLFGKKAIFAMAYHILEKGEEPRPCKLTVRDTVEIQIDDFRFTLDEETTVREGAGEVVVIEKSGGA